MVQNKQLSRKSFHTAHTQHISALFKGTISKCKKVDQPPNPLSRRQQILEEHGQRELYQSGHCYSFPWAWSKGVMLAGGFSYICPRPCHLSALNLHPLPKHLILDHQPHRPCGTVGPITGHTWCVSIAAEPELPKSYVLEAASGRATGKALVMPWSLSLPASVSAAAWHRILGKSDLWSDLKNDRPYVLVYHNLGASTHAPNCAVVTVTVI